MNAYCCIMAGGVDACHLAVDLEIDVPNAGYYLQAIVYYCSKNLPHRVEVLDGSVDITILLKWVLTEELRRAMDELGLP